MVDPPELTIALLRWVQAFQTSRTVNAWDDLRDGHVLWEILHDIDPDYFTESLPESRADAADNWIPRWQNLKHINRLVIAYVRDMCGTLEEPSRNMTPDLKAIATDASPQDTVMLLKVILRTAMYSPASNQRMGRILVGLGPEVAKPIAAAMSQMEESDREIADARKKTETEGNSEIDVSTDSELASSTRRTSVERDPELEQEEKLIQAYKTIKQLESTNAKVATELEELRKEKESLQEAFETFRYEAETEGRRKAENDSVKQLQSKADRDRDYIAELETELESTRSAVQAHERQMERLKMADTDAKQKLRDDLQFLRAERDELLQKTRANENLKKKIQTLQDQEKANATLKEDLRVANEQLLSLDKLKEQCTTLQKANAENMKTIANGEQEIFDQKTSRKRLEHEYKVLAQKWEAAKERQSRDHETITELENKIQTLEMGTASLNGQTPGGLEDEIAASENAKAEEQKTKSLDTIPSAEFALLQQKLDALNARNAKLETEYLDLLQDKLGLETTVEDLREPSREPEENVPFLEQRKKLQATEVELSELRNTCFSTTTELSKAKEKLLAAGKALQETGNNIASLDGNAEYQALVDRYSELHEHSEGLESSLEEQRSLLRHALLSQATLLKESDDIRRSNEYKLVVHQLEGVRDADPETDVLMDTAADLTNRIESGRLASLAADKRAAEQASAVEDLKKQLEAAQNPATLSKSQMQDMTNLQRENQLMTSAWYDLASRIQSNTVMVGRRKESPKSWLGKQRTLVAGVGVQQHHRR